MLSFEDVPYSKPQDNSGSQGIASEDVQTSLRYINSHHTVQPYKPLGGNPVFVFVKKVIRKLTKFYVEPVVFEQNEFNGHTVKVINALKSTAEKDSESAAKQDELLSRIEVLELNQKQLAVQIDALIKENRALKDKLGKQD